MQNSRFKTVVMCNFSHGEHVLASTLYRSGYWMFIVAQHSVGLHSMEYGRNQKALEGAEFPLTASVLVPCTVDSSHVSGKRNLLRPLNPVWQGTQPCRLLLTGTEARYLSVPTLPTLLYCQGRRGPPEASGNTFSVVCPGCRSHADVWCWNTQQYIEGRLTSTCIPIKNIFAMTCPNMTPPIWHLVFDINI